MLITPPSSLTECRSLKSKKTPSCGGSQDARMSQTLVTVCGAHNLTYVCFTLSDGLISGTETEHVSKTIFLIHMSHLNNQIQII